MDEDLKLYIPLGVKPEAELFTGFGKKQLFQSIVVERVDGCSRTGLLLLFCMPVFN